MPAGSPAALECPQLRARNRDEHNHTSVDTLRTTSQTCSCQWTLSRKAYGSITQLIFHKLAVRTHQHNGWCYDRTSDNPTVDARIAVTSAEFVLQALSTYVVPLLYGLLGAFAYVLREIAEEVRAVTFSHESCIRYNLRLSLGLLAGITVGFLVSPEAGQGAVQQAQPILTLATLGPMALAFLAGYSVELVFAVMDRIVSAFVDEKSPPNR